jgi:hypothetical protein
MATSWKYNTRTGEFYEVERKKRVKRSRPPYVAPDPSLYRDAAFQAKERMSGLTLAKAGAVQVDDTLKQAIEELMNLVAPEIADAYNDHFVPMAQDAFAKWPVGPDRPGRRHSKALLKMEFEVKNGGREFGAVLTSAAPYTLYIRRGQTVKFRMFQPFEKSTARIIKQLERGK